MTLKTCGIRTDNIHQSLLPYTFLFFFLGISMLLFLKTGYYLPQLIRLYHTFYNPLLLVIPLSILQEIVFMGLIMPMLRKKFKSAFVVIGITVMLFTLAHLIFPYPEIILPGAFIAGLGFALTYYYYPNLILISIVHVLLNYLPVSFCALKLINCSL